MAGPIEQSLVGVTDRKEIARLRAQGILAAFQALPAGQRAAFVYDGLQVTVLAAPVVLRDRSGNIVGLQVRARARDANGQLPFTDGLHRVVNPPAKVPDGGIDAEGLPTFVEDPITALKRWLVNSIRVEARMAGWVG